MARSGRGARSRCKTILCFSEPAVQQWPALAKGQHRGCCKQLRQQVVAQLLQPALGGLACATYGATMLLRGSSLS